MDCMNSCHDPGDECPEVKKLLLQNRLLQELVAEFVEGGEIDPHEEDPKCPQDDTCECKRAKRLNDALRGYEEKRKCDMTGPCEDGHVCRVEDR